MTTEITIAGNDRQFEPSLLKARTSMPRIGTMNRKALEKDLAVIIYRAYMYRGQNIAEGQTEFSASALADELLSDKYGYKIPMLTVPEIDYAVRKAVLREDTFISVASLYRWIIGYVQTEGNAITNEIYKQKHSTGPITPCPEVQALIEKYTNKLAIEAKI